MLRQKPIPKLSKKQIDHILRLRPLENLKTIQELESIFMKRRGYVIKSPSPGEKVIVPFSGGLDSVTISTILMQIYKVEIYPLFTCRGQSYQHAEEVTAQYFYEYFQKRFPGQFHPIKKVTALFPPMEIRDAYEKVENKPVKKGSPQIWGDYFYIPLLHITAVQYAYNLQIKHGFKIRTVISGVMARDGNGKQDHTLTCLRSIMMQVCAATNDYTWQVYAFPIEKELGFFYDKDFFVKWGTANKVPLAKTRSSCKSTSLYHCGICHLCSMRRSAFKRAEIPDPTIYRPPMGQIIGNKGHLIYDNIKLNLGIKTFLESTSQRIQSWFTSDD